LGLAPFPGIGGVRKTKRGRFFSEKRERKFSASDRSSHVMGRKRKPGGNPVKNKGGFAIT